MSSMRACIFHGVNDIRVEDAKPEAGPGEAVIRITLTTICGTLEIGHMGNVAMAVSRAIIAR